MKRTLAYMLTGIMLGIAIMFIPLITFIPPDVHHFSAPTLVDSARKLGIEEYKSAAAPSEAERTLGVGGGITFPSSLLYAGLIFAVGLVSALGAHGLFKRRLMS